MGVSSLDGIVRSVVVRRCGADGRVSRWYGTGGAGHANGNSNSNSGRSMHEWPPERFDPEALSRGVRVRPWKLFSRSARVFGEVLLLRLGAFFHIGGMRGRAERLRNALVRLGPAFTKFGQALATRPDVLPREYCEELAKLQDKVPSFPTTAARETIAAELQMPVADVFEEFGTEPVAAASLAQVYRARLRGSGEVVAVKVQRPNLHETIALDAIILRSLARTVGSVFSVRSDLAGVMDELVGRIFEEIDFTREAASMSTFYDTYDSRAIEQSRSEKTNSATMSTGGGGGGGGTAGVAITVPRVHTALCTRRVLVMEWMAGVKLTDLDALQVMGVDRRLLLDSGVRCSLRQLLRDGHFHADPHPGNLMATEEGLAYLDFGMMCRISNADRYGLLRLLVSFVNRDAGIMAIELRQLGFLPHNAKLAAVEASIHDALRAGDADLENKDFQGAVEQLSSVLRAQEHDFRVPPRYALIIRALGALEGVATLLQPGFKVVAVAYPIVLEFLIEDKSPEMRRILQSMILTSEGHVRWARVQRLLEAARGTSDADDNEGGGDDTVHYSSYSSEFSSWIAAASSPWEALTGARSRQATEIDVKLADAIGDALGFLESRRSEYVRRKLVDDVLESMGSVRDTENLSTHGKPTDGGGLRQSELSDLVDRMQGPARWIVGRIRSAPDVWLPVVARVASSRATHEILYSVVRGGMRRYDRNTVEELLIFLSGLLRASGI